MVESKFGGPTRRIVVVGNGATAFDDAGNSLVNRHTSEFLTGLARLGNRVIFVQPLNAYRAGSNLYDWPLSPEWVQSRSIDRRGPLSLIRTLPPVLWHFLRADFVYLFFPGTLPRAVARLCHILGKPYGLYLRGQEFSTAGPDAMVFGRARFIVSVSRFLADGIVRLNPRIIPIRPMLDIAEADALDRDFTRAVDAPWRLLFVGRLEAAKGVPELVTAMELLRDRGFPFSLTLVGGGPLHDDLATAYGNAPGGHIRVLGPISDRMRLMKAYADADILVLPTHHEGFPRVLYEAMINSLVILTTMVGGIPGLMQDGRNCLAIEKESPASIADAIERACRSPSAFQALAEGGLETVLDVLSTHPSHLEALSREMNV